MSINTAKPLPVPRTDSASLKAAPVRQSVGRQSSIRRLLLQYARKLHDQPLFYSAMVRGFRLLQRIGINVTPNHFYWPVPDLADLERRDWCAYPRTGNGFDLNDQAQLARELMSAYGAECEFPDEPCERSYHYDNGYFEAVDAELAYCIVRHFKPAQIVEVGTGYSTRVLAAALEVNAQRDQFDGQLISIDPNPERLPAAEWSDRVQQVPQPIQSLDLGFFDGLASGDVLFIDSSHVVATGSDVTHEFLQILPRLRSGVIVHFHDIFLPSDYPRDAVLNNLWFWSEQYLLQAFLSFNHEFEVLWGSSAMQTYKPWVLEQWFPRWRHSYRKMPETMRRFIPTADGDRVWPSSFWMRRV